MLGMGRWEGKLRGGEGKKVIGEGEGFGSVRGLGG